MGQPDIDQHCGMKRNWTQWIFPVILDCFIPCQLKTFNVSNILMVIKYMRTPVKVGSYWSRHFFHRVCFCAYALKNESNYCSLIVVLYYILAGMIFSCTGNTCAIHVTLMPQQQIIHYSKNV